MAAVVLRRKYREGYRYKNQKSKSSNSGHSKKNAVKGRSQAHKKHDGQKVLLINMSSEPMYCANTGARLPFRGMVVRSTSGDLVKNFDAL